MITISALPAFKDNYIWLLSADNKQCVVVDPGDAEVVLSFLEKNKLSLAAILITHHHKDHTGGIATLLQHHSAIVYGPADENIAEVQIKLREGESIFIKELSITFTILDIPGHTRGHIGYYSSPILFCGDTLFLGGCGRLFEGTADQLYSSLQKIAHLPDDTLIYCTHEYTTTNLQFALTIEPENKILQQRIIHTAQLREQNIPTVPDLLSQEKLTNPFLRCDQCEVIISVKSELDENQKLDPVTVFAALRRMKDLF